MHRLSMLSRVVLPLALAAAVGCDDATLDPAPAPGATIGVAEAPLFLGRVVADADELAPVAQAQVLIELVTDDGAELEPIEVATDDEGYFELDTLPEGVTLVTAHVFVDGEHGGSESIPVQGGVPVVRSMTMIVVTYTVVCIATTWASARKISGTDKLRHCVASCRATRWCGLGAAWTAAVIKEMFDQLCSYGPQWLKDLLRPVSGCGGWDAADMQANGRGIWCAGKWKTCENCCNDYY
ncbi:MAG: hypothetical protein IT385_19810 [Deltaproteobacteria bacterium]|nr:hypothetical protein [Deltaproteobacteria bacterium]